MCSMNPCTVVYEARIVVCGRIGVLGEDGDVEMLKAKRKERSKMKHLG